MLYNLIVAKKQKLDEELKPTAIVPEYTDLFDQNLLSAYECASLEKRFAAARRQVKSLLSLFRELKVPHSGGVPPRPARMTVDMHPIKNLVREILTKEREHPGMKSGVVSKIFDEISRYYLWSNLSSLPIFHELTVLVPWWAINRAQFFQLKKFSDFLVGETLRGIVLSLQRVRENILSSKVVYLAHCVCRSAGIAHDLRQSGRIFTLLPKDEKRLLLDRLLNRYIQIGQDRLHQTTHGKLRAIIERLIHARQANSSDYSLERLLELTYWMWEILPIMQGYTTNWVRSMQNNNKCFVVDKELAYELLNIFYFAKGAIFNSMICVNSPYTICVCPTPENGGGCALTNWYYFSELNNSLLPADDHYGRLRNEKGQILPCRYFPLRSRRECIGCGCNHQLLKPRDLTCSLEDSDRVLAQHKDMIPR